jgi:hypothetical protein
VKEILFSKENFTTIQKFLGKRPGDKYVDPYYLRTSLADKPYFWNDTRKRWELVSLGDLFILNDDGSVDRIPVAQVKGKSA